MANEIAIKVQNVTKTFKLPHEKTTSIKGAVVNFYKRKNTYEQQKVLDNISFEVKKGEFFGIVGRNGSGKSTLLKLLAGIYVPDSGDIQINGQLTPFIELGVGFNPELTGRENVFLNGALLGFSRPEMEAMYDEIVAFAELSRFMDQKLKNYSSGMQVRLAFSIAIRANTDILLVDEVLAVGDSLFQQKCYDYFQQIKNSDKTVVFISHDMGAVQSFCDRAILIDNSKMILKGTAPEVTARYSQLLSESSEAPQYSSDKYAHIGVGGAEITKAEILNAKGKPTRKIAEGEPFTIRVYYNTTKHIEGSVCGIGIMGTQDQSILGPNTRESGYTYGALSPEGYFEAHFKNVPLSTGTYRIRAGIFNASVTIPYDFVEKLLTITIIGKKRFGDMNIDPEWKVT